MSQPWSKIGELPPPRTPPEPPTKVIKEEEEAASTTAAENEKIKNGVERFLVWIQTPTSPISPRTQTLIDNIYTDASPLLSTIFILSKSPQTSNPHLTAMKNPRMSLLLTEILTKFNQWAVLLSAEDVESIGLGLCKLVWLDSERSGLSEAWKRVWIKNFVQIFWGVGGFYGWNI